MTAAVWACGEEKSRRETEARQLRPAATEGQGTDAPADPAPQVLVLERTNSSPKYRTLTAPCAPGGTEATPGRISSEPGPPDRRVARGRDFFNATSPGAKTRSWRGAGRGRAPTRSFHARGQLPAQSGLCLGPRPLAPGKQQRSSQKGEGRGGERQGQAGPQPGASQRAESGHPAPRSASRAIAGRGSRCRARGSAGPTRAPRGGQAEVTERRAPAARSQPRSGCGMGGGAARPGEGCSAAVRSRSRCPG